MNMKRFVLLATVFLVTSGALTLAQDVPGPVDVPLWDKGAPGYEDRKDEKEIISKGRVATNIHNPYFTVYLPPKDKATGVGIIVCPGGGHQTLNFGGEGIDISKMLNKEGIAGFVLHYRMGNDKGSKLPKYKIPDAALQDAQRAMRLIRANAKSYGVDPNKIGMMGFSAGGEVTVWATTKYDKGKPDAEDLVERQGSRPDFQALVYSGPTGVRNAKLTKDVPPAFIIIGDKDGQAKTMSNYADSLKNAGVSTKFILYPGIGHAFGLGDRKGNTSEALKTWPATFKEWLVEQKMLAKTEK